MPTIVHRDGGLAPALLWNPFSMFDRLERAWFGGSDWFEWPAFDIEDTGDEAIVTADMPGVHEDDLEVTVSGTELVVRGERKPGSHMRRRPYGAFERRFELASGFDLDRASAELVDGVLSIRIPKRPEAKPRRIKVTSGARRVVDKVKGLLGGDKSA